MTGLTILSHAEGAIAVMAGAAEFSVFHITPDESEWWGFQGGDALKVFDTDIGKIGILICFDVEFPELPRLLADKGVKILLVPYWTDIKNAYLRVRRCAQARAIENECYVAIADSVRNIESRRADLYSIKWIG